MQGKKTRYVYMRGYSRVFLAVPFLVISRLLGVTRVHVLEDGIKVSEYRFYTNKVFKTFWPFVSLIDSLLYSFIFFHLCSISYKGLTISDRSIVDTLVDIIADTQDCYFFKHYGRYFLNLIPKNSVVVLLDVDEKTAIKRKKDVLNLRYLKKRRAIYRKLADRYKWVIINTNTDFDIVHQKLLRVFD